MQPPFKSPEINKHTPMFIPDSRESPVFEFLNKIHQTGPKCPACEMLLQKKRKKEGILILQGFLFAQPIEGTGGKGQIISKCLFDVFNFLQKTNENKST